jgi:signal transduction histidine kinase
LSVIKNILDISRIKSGEVVSQRTNFSLEHLIEERQRIFEVAAKEKNITLSLTALTQPIELSLDRTGLKQVIVNLLGNALKFSDADGQVELSCNLDAEDVLSISDTGTGIPPEVRTRYLSHSSKPTIAIRGPMTASILAFTYHLRLSRP